MFQSNTKKPGPPIAFSVQFPGAHDKVGLPLHLNRPELAAHMMTGSESARPKPSETAQNSTLPSSRATTQSGTPVMLMSAAVT